MQVFALVQCMRIQQWTKNFLLFAALLFSIGHPSYYRVYICIVAFIIFCLVSSSVYLLNDFIDRNADFLNPEKCTRPMACGLLKPAVGLFGCFVLLCTSVLLGFFLDFKFGLIIVIYFINNILYSFKIKHLVLLDIMSIAAGFVLRAIGGGVAIRVPLTPWFLLCVFLLSLFLAIGKRRYELNIMECGTPNFKRVLTYYTTAFLDQLMTIVAASTIMCYSLFTFTSGRPIELMYTIPLVIYGMFRYLYLVHVEKKGGSPEKILIGDKHILLSVVLFSAAVIIILNFSS